MRFRFVRWGKDGEYAIFQVDSTYVNIPFSRLIPNPFCEAYYRSLGIKDPNEIARRCAEESSVFGPALFRHFEHLLLKYGNPLVREKEKEYEFPSNIDFACVRELILKGVSTDEAIRRCTR